jgi:HAL2 family 3'(2'),5'-bisphosphate nucleotidase
MTPLDDFAAPMIDAVRAGSRICRAVQATLTAGDSVRKYDKSPVTVADLATQAVIARRLADAFAGVPLVGEEDSKVFDEGAGAGLCAAVLTRVRGEWPAADDRAMRAAIDLGRAEGGPRGRFFTLDPIDGTKGFLRGGQYAVALALIEDGRIVAGALGCPNLPGAGGTGVVLFASRGAGTRALAVDGIGPAGTSTRVSAEADPARVRLCESVESGHTDQGATRSVLARLGVLAEPVRMDSQAKYGVLAMGRAEVYLRTPTKPGRSEWIWDHAAGVICVEEAGGRVTDLDGKPLDFGTGRALTANRGVVATNGIVHDRVLAAVATG